MAYHLICSTYYHVLVGGGGHWSAPRNSVIDVQPAQWIIDQHRVQELEFVVLWATEISEAHYNALAKLEFVGSYSTDADS